MSVYVITSNDESVSVFSSKKKAIESLSYMLDGLDDIDPDILDFISGNREINIDQLLHVEGGVTYIWHVLVDSE